MGESVQHVQVWGEVENGDRDGEGAGEASMKLPASTNIAREKVTRYLLVPQTRGDKSGFLGLAGYAPENADQLLRDLRNQLLPLDAVPTKSDKVWPVLRDSGQFGWAERKNPGGARNLDD